LQSGAILKISPTFLFSSKLKRRFFINLHKHHEAQPKFSSTMAQAQAASMAALSF